MVSFPCPSATPLFVWALVLNVLGVALLGCALAFVRLAWVSRGRPGWWLLPAGILTLADLVLAEQVIVIGWQIYANEVLGPSVMLSSRACLVGGSALLVESVGIVVGQPGVWGFVIALALIALNWLLSQALARGARTERPVSPRRVRLAWIGFGVATALEVAWCVGLVLNWGEGFGAIPWPSIVVYTGLALEVALCVAVKPRPVVGWWFPRRAVAAVLLLALVLACLGGLATWFVATPDTVSVLVVIDSSGNPTYPPPLGDTQRQVYARTLTGAAVAQAQAVVASVPISPLGAVYSCPAFGDAPAPVYALAFVRQGILVETAVIVPEGCTFVTEDAVTLRCCVVDATWQALSDATGVLPPSSYAPLGP